MQELNIKQKRICLVPSSKRNPGKEGAASGGKGKGQSPPQGASLPHSALRVPGLRTSRGDAGLWKPTDCTRPGEPLSGRTGCRVHACLSVSSIPISYLLQVERRG